jgi:hypothetical protein
MDSREIVSSNRDCHLQQMICLRKQIHFSIDNELVFLFTEPAISTAHCPRLYGIFADEVKCDVFWNCWNGEASRYQCSPGLAYDREARVCMWADQVPECKNEGLLRSFSSKGMFV